MGITIGPEAHTFAVKWDETRIERSKIRASDASKNFKRVFLETTFFKLACMISEVLLNRLIWNFVWTFSIHPSVV